MKSLYFIRSFGDGPLSCGSSSLADVPIASQAPGPFWQDFFRLIQAIGLNHGSARCSRVSLIVFYANPVLQRVTHGICGYFRIYLGVKLSQSLPPGVLSARRTYGEIHASIVWILEGLRQC